MEIGQPKRTITIIPLSEPVPGKKPIEAPKPEPEKVPA